MKIAEDKKVLRIMKKGRERTKKESERIMNEYTETLILNAFAREEKDKERIEELEKTISDLCKTIRSIPYGWCGIEQVEKAEKVLKNEN
jgi:hypothetical protein